MKTFRDRTSVRLLVSLALGLLAGWLLRGAAGGALAAALLGWVAGCLFFLVTTWVILWRMDGDDARDHARVEEPARAVAEGLVILASVVSLLGVGLLVLGSQGGSQGGGAVVAACTAVATVAASWFMVHTLYTLRYARLWYGSEDDPPVTFDDGELTEPTYPDFAYLAFTLGMTYQVSDTDLKGTEMRRMVLFHCLLSYLFGTVVLASTINLVVSLAGGG